jgi:heat-inducible transcriptional repressor
MADLEEAGYIMQPHTSAGRVPTDKGYRLYVDTLLEPRRLTKEEEALIYRMIHHAGADIDAIMQAASKMISVISNLAGIALTPQLKKSAFKHIEFIPLDASHVLAVLITGSGLVKNSMLDMEMEIARSELARISEFMNHELEDMLLGDIRQYLARRLLEGSDSFYSFLKKATNIMSKPSFLKTEDSLYCDGATCIVSHPEFRDIQKVRMFLKAFEDKHDLINLLYDDMEKQGAKVHIGRENALKDVQDLSVVTCNYIVDGNIVGAVAALGPTRMEYGKVIATVSYVASLLGKALEDIG